MDRVVLTETIEKNRIEWSSHCLRVMLERGISRDAVKYVVRFGEVIEDYPEVQPFPCALIFEFWQNMPLHVVVAYDANEKKAYIITAYLPDEEHFESDFKTRR